MSIDARTEEIVMPSNSGGCMRDLHVVSLSYSLKHGDDVTYDSPPPVVFETPEAEFLLTDAGLSCRMKIHFATTKEARAVVEPVLRAWEVDADLRRGKVELRFKFVSTEVVDRSPTPPGTLRGRVLHTDAGEFLVITDSASSSVTRRKYPEPPGDFRVSPDVETLYHRFQGYRDGKEPLLAMAYFCLTVLKTRTYLKIIDF